MTLRFQPVICHCGEERFPSKIPETHEEPLSVNGAGFRPTMCSLLKGRPGRPARRRDSMGGEADLFVLASRRGVT